MSLKPCSELSYVFRKREGVVDNLEPCAQFKKYSTITSSWKAENILVITIRSLPILVQILQASLGTDSSLSTSFLTIRVPNSTAVF